MNTAKIPWVIIVISIILTLGVLYLYPKFINLYMNQCWNQEILLKQDNTSHDLSQFGQLGDSFGILTSIFSFLSFIFLLLTFLAQRKDAKADKIEASFFQLITIHEGLVSDMRYGEDVSGRAVFTSYLNFINNEEGRGRDTEDVLELCRNSFDVLWLRERRYLAHYFRYVYNVYKFIDEEDVDPEVKARLLRLYRAQISDLELILLYYNCISKTGEGMRKYAIKYKLFDNFPFDDFLIHHHWDLRKDSLTCTLMPEIKKYQRPVESAVERLLDK